MKTYFVKAAIGIGALWLLGAGTACTSLHFDRLPGTPHGRIPWNLRGTYYMDEDKKKQERIQVQVGEYQMIWSGTAAHDSDCCDTMTLNQDFRLHELSGNIYCLGTSDTLENGTGVWNISVIKDRRKRLEVYPLNSGKAMEHHLDAYLSSRDSGTFKTYVMDDARFYQFCRRKLKRTQAGYLMRMP
jgi:hypothetical protein